MDKRHKIILGGSLVAGALMVVGAIWAVLGIADAFQEPVAPVAQEQILEQANNIAQVQPQDQILGYNSPVANPYILTTSTTTRPATTTEWNGDVNPRINNAYNLGSASKVWKNLFIGGTSYASNTSIGTLTATKLTATNVSSTAIDATRYVSTTKMITGVGSAASPSFTFQGDPDTGVFQNGANIVALTGAGSVKLDAGSAGIRLYSVMYPAVNNTHDLGAATVSWKDVYASGTVRGVNMSLSGNATTSIATGRYELGRQGDVGSPFDWWHMYISAGVAGTRQHAIASIGDKSIMGMYCENSGVAQVCQNPSFNVFVPIKQGQPYKTTYNYAWTTDGCRAQINTNSSTAPTYAATSTSFCP